MSPGGLPVGQLYDLMQPPAVKNLLEYRRIDGGFDAGGAEQRFDHGFIEKFRAVSGKRLIHGKIDLSPERFREDVGCQPGAEQRHAQDVVTHDRTMEFPVRIFEIVAPGGPDRTQSARYIHPAAL